MKVAANEGLRRSSSCVGTISGRKCFICCVFFFLSLFFLPWEVACIGPCFDCVARRRRRLKNRDVHRVFCPYLVLQYTSYSSVCLVCIPINFFKNGNSVRGCFFVTRRGVCGLLYSTYEARGSYSRSRADTWRQRQFPHPYQRKNRRRKKKQDRCMEPSVFLTLC